MNNRAYSVLTIKAVDEDRRVVTGIATTPTVDRVGDIIDPLGVKFDNPLAFVQAKQVGATRATKTRPARGNGIDVRITFKNAKDAREGTVRASAADADGMFYAYLAFPEGTDSGTKPTSVSEPER